MTNPRSKGKRAERDVVRQLKEWGGDGFGRTAFSRGRNTRTEDITTPEWFKPVIEVKNREGWSWPKTLTGDGPIWSWWEQAQSQADNYADAIPWLVFTRNREALWVMLPVWSMALHRVDFTLVPQGVSVVRLPRLLDLTKPEDWAR